MQSAEHGGFDDGAITSPRRVALVTGTSSGIGLWTAVEFAAAGLHVVATGGIDVVVNNAGRGLVGTLEQLDDATLQAQLDVNYLAVARLTRCVLPVMRAAGHGRVVTVTSVGGAVGQPFADGYCAAKFAVEGLMQSLAPVVAQFGVDISIVEPAAVASHFVANTGADDAPPDPPTRTRPHSLLI